MAAITGMVLGAASLGYGLYSKMQANDDMEEGYAKQQAGYLQQSQAAKAAANISREQAASSVEFAGRERSINEQANRESLTAFTQSNAINRNMVNLQQQQEGVRMQAMEVDASRRSREAVRNLQRSRSMALTNATASGASRGSGLQGGYGQIAGAYGNNQNAITSSLLQGREMFGLNSQMTGQRLAFNDIENMVAMQRANTQTAKSNLAFDYASLNAAYQTRQAGVQEMMSAGQGTVNSANGMIQMGQSNSQNASQFIQAGLQLPTIGANFNQLYQTNWGQPTAASSTQANFGASMNFFGGKLGGA